MKLGPIGFIKHQFTTVPPVVTPDLTGRVVIVTGANIGLGYEAALHLSRCNPARLIIAVRNVKAGEEAARKIVQVNGGKCVPEVWNLDLGDMKNVKAFGERVNKDLDRLDIFLSNAGISTRDFTTTIDGLESTSQVNNVANSLLSVLVLPLLLRTAKNDLADGVTTPYPDFKPHLTIVSSEVHYWVDPKKLPGVKQGRKDLIKAMQEEALFNKEARYLESKLINVLNVDTLAELAGPSIVVNSVNPGLCYSALMRETSGFLAIIVSIMKVILARTTEQGARTEVWAATQPTPPGAFSDLCAVSEPLDWTFSPEGRAVGKEVWEEMKAIWKEKAGVHADQVLAGGKR